MTWIKELFDVDKPIIAMCHLRALPGDPDYDQARGMDWVVQQARTDLHALQDGGVDGVMFSNESSLPYLTKVEAITLGAMGRVIGELRAEIRVPFGVNVLWDAEASIDLAVAVDAVFVREIFTGVYASDFGLWNTNVGSVVRHRNRVGGKHVRLLFNVVPESAAYLAGRDIEEVTRSTVFNTRPDALCVSGLTAGVEASVEVLTRAKAAAQATPVLANTGVRLENVERQLAIADGAIVGTTLKRDGYIWNEVDIDRVRAFMGKVRATRGSVGTS
jgi:uncharacterized protein